MHIERRAAAVVLWGGWLLLFNPDRLRPDVSLATWKKLGEYDTAYECEQHRRTKIMEALEKDRKAKSDDPMTGTEAELRHLCERAERVPPPR
jgi:hypothetical protein